MGTVWADDVELSSRDLSIYITGIELKCISAKLLMVM